MREHGGARSRRLSAFTLIELLVSISIIGVLIGILAPVLGSARDSAQQTKCAGNLRQMAAASLTYSNDNKGSFCTGPWDNRKNNSYGAIDEKGWVADMVNGGYAVPGDMLCPSHPAQYNQNLIMSRLNNHPWKAISEADRDALVDRGFNSNYVQSWYMGFTAMKDHYNTALDPKRINGVIGPLQTKNLGIVPATMVPLFGDGRTEAASEGYIDIHGSHERTVKAFGDGPVQDAAQNGVFTYQDYADFGPAHGRASFIGGAVSSDRVFGQIAFADGHVAGFRDLDRNGTFGWASDSTGIALRDQSGRPMYPEFDGKVFPGWITNGAYP